MPDWDDSQSFERYAVNFGSHQLDHELFTPYPPNLKPPNPFYAVDNEETLIGSFSTWRFSPGSDGDRMEYLQNLNVRSKLCGQQRNLACGDVVLVKDINQIHTKFQCCELDLRSVVFVTLLQVWLTNSQDDMTKKHL